MLIFREVVVVVHVHISEVSFSFLHSCDLSFEKLRSYLIVGLNPSCVVGPSRTFEPKVGFSAAEEKQTHCLLPGFLMNWLLACFGAHYPSLSS